MRTIEITSADKDFSQVESGCVLTIGNFDGLHLGHQEILTVARQIAAEKATQLAAMTFEPHPVTVLQPEKTPKVLTLLKMKQNLLASLGVDTFIVIKDTAKLLTLSADEFVAQFLTTGARPIVVVEGHDFNFGAERSGSVETLKQAGADNGFDVVVVEPKEITFSTGQHIRVSSTMIRYMLESGHVADAALALGRPYQLAGPVIAGRGKGKHLGFPTLNMEPPGQIIPAEGVYAGFVKIANSFQQVLTAKESLPAALSIGQARTFGEEYPLLIEGHLLIENAERFKGRWIAMDFVEHIRSQHKFNTEAELSAEIAKDCEKAKQILNK